MKSRRDIDKVKANVKIWNEEHNDMFKIKELENDEFRGVIRLFNFDEDNQIQTRCIQATSHDTTYDLLQAFIRKTDNQKFVPDYTVYTVLSNGDYTDFPLLKQISWVETAHDARFLVKSAKPSKNVHSKENLSKDQTSSDTLENRTDFILHLDEELKQDILELFSRIPTSKISSGINNQDQCLKRQRQQKLTKKIDEFLEFENQFGNKLSGQPESLKTKLGTIKVFTGTVFPECQYKTLIISIYDSTKSIIKEVISKIPQTKNSLRETDYFLTMCVSQNNTGKKLIKPNKTEYRILDDDYPLFIQNKYTNENSQVTFHVRKYANYNSSTSSRETKPEVSQPNKKHFAIIYAVDSPKGSKPKDHPTTINLGRDLVVLGSNTYAMKNAEIFGQKPTQIVCLNSETIHSIHCAISTLNGTLTVTPSAMDADVRVDDVQIFETTMLCDGARLSIGCKYFFEISVPTKISANMSQIYWKTYMNKSKIPKQPTIEKKIVFSKQTSVNLLPLYLKFERSYFDQIIEKFITLIHEIHLQFKPSPSYLIYLLFISQLDNYMIDEEISDDRVGSKSPDFRSFCKISYKILSENNMLRNSEPEIILSWMVNISELYYFLHQDIQMNQFTEDVQKFCEQCLRITVNEITRNFENDFTYLIDGFFRPLIEANNVYQQLDSLINYDPTTALDISKILLPDRKKNSNQNRPSDAHSCDISDILRFFNRWMSLFCLFNINASFTVQIFQRMFCTICKNLIDKVIKHDMPHHKRDDLIDAMRVNFNLLQIWAESQGLEMIIGKCFSSYIKIIDFYESDFSTVESFSSAIEQLDFLNSKQLEMILGNLLFVLTPAKVITKNFQKIFKQVTRMAIVNLREKEVKNNIDTKNLKIEFPSQIIKPCFISPNGYSSENPQEVSNILYKVIKNLEISDIKVLRSQDNHSHWNCRFKDDVDKYNFTDKKTEYMIITIHKEDNLFYGIRIVSVKNSETGNMGIYVVGIQDNSIMKNDGRLAAGDQLISANGISLVGVEEQEAARIIQSCKNKLRLEVIKQSAQIHGIYDLLSKGNTQENAANEKVTSKDSSEVSTPTSKINFVSNSIQSYEDKTNKKENFEKVFRSEKTISPIEKSLFQDARNISLPLKESHQSFVEKCNSSFPDNDKIKNIKLSLNKLTISKYKNISSSYNSENKTSFMEIKKTDAVGSNNKFPKVVKDREYV